jgi:glycosyltransferase involved in cell wall biosynthesis
MSKRLTYVISSPHDTYSGYGARARDYIKSVIELDKYDVKLMSQRWGETAWGFCDNEPEWAFLKDHLLPDNKLEGKPDIWSQITIPNEFQPVGKYNIGVTAGIETTVCAGDWIEGMNRMDINFVSSQHSKKVFQTTQFEKKDKEKTVGHIKLEKPIEVLFEGLNLDTYKKLTPKEVSLDLSQIKESFCYLFVGHWMQGSYGHDRKNVGLLVKSFLETFKNQKNKPALILKASIGSSSYVSREELLKRVKALRKTVNSTNLPNIYIMNGDLSDSKMNELYNHSKVKAMLSFTKGEGYGRPLLEFSAIGKPVIASGWSGQVDFLHPEKSFLIGGELEQVHSSSANQWIMKESKWFKPDLAIIGGVLKDTYKNYKGYAVKGKKQGYYSRTNFSFGKMTELLGTYFDKYVNVPEELELQLPKLEKID